MEIALVDSFFEERDGRQVKEIDLTESDDPWTHTHGTWVDDICKIGAEDASIHLYRIIDGSGEYERWDLLKVLEELKFADHDIINLSLGNFKPNCAGHCLECRVVDQVVESGSVVVASAGNADKHDGTCCPAKSDRIISVGGFQDLCRFEPSFAPTAIWIRKPDPEPDEEAYTETICSHIGCSDMMRCRRNVSRRLWGGNVEFDKLPTTLAPVHHVVENDDGHALINSGTSFSAGYVSGALATLFSEISDGDVPNPDKLIESIEQSRWVSDIGVPFFDVSHLQTEFS